MKKVVQSLLVCVLALSSLHALSWRGTDQTSKKQVAKSSWFGGNQPKRGKLGSAPGTFVPAHGRLSGAAEQVNKIAQELDANLDQLEEITRTLAQAGADTRDALMAQAQALKVVIQGLESQLANSAYAISEAAGSVRGRIQSVMNRFRRHSA